MIPQFSDIVRPDNSLLDQLRATALRVSDPGTIRAHLSSVMAPHDFCLGGRRSNSVELWHGSADLNGIALHYIDYQCDAESVTVAVNEPHDTIFVKFPLTGETRVCVDGKDYIVHPNEFTAIGANKPFRTTMHGCSRHLSLIISGSWIAQYVAKQGLSERSGRFNLASSVHNIPTDGILLASTLAGLLASMCRNDPMLGTQSVTTHLKELITSVVLGLSPNYREASCGLAVPDVIPGYIRRAERFIKDHLDEPITMDDIVRHAGTTRRTLHAGFQKHCNTSPMALLKSLRLRAAKSALENPALDANGVTRIAMTYGFYNLGRFSQEFKCAFGLLPSELRRRHS